MNRMRCGLLALSMGMVMTGPVHAFDLNKMTESANQAVDSASQKADATLDQASETANSGMAVTGEAQGLVDSLTSDLGVTQQQAAGGAGALLAMAKSNLSGDQFAGILDKVPGLDSLMGGGEGGGMASSLLGNISSMEGVSKAFGALGLSPDMITQFAPKILGFSSGEKGLLAACWTALAASGE